MFGGLPIFPQNGISGQVLYAHFNIFDLKVKLKGSVGLSPELRKIIEDGEDGNNPVIVIATLK